MQYELNLNIPTIFNLVYMCEKCRHVNERTCKKCSKLQLYISQNLETVQPQQNEHKGVKSNHTLYTRECG